MKKIKWQQYRGHRILEKPLFLPFLSSVYKTWTWIAQDPSDGVSGAGRGQLLMLGHRWLSVVVLLPRRQQQSSLGFLTPAWLVPGRVEPSAGAGEGMGWIIPISRADLASFKLTYLHINESTLGHHYWKPPNKCLMQLSACIKRKPTPYLAFISSQCLINP